MEGVGAKRGVLMKKPSPILAVTIREEERGRLARLLEKRLGSSLNLFLAQAKAYHTAFSPSTTQTRQAIHTLVGMAARTLIDLNDLVAELNPRDLNDLGLGPALETLALRLERHYGFVTTFDFPPSFLDSSTEHAPVLPSTLALAIYRLTQEALHNTGQHAGAGRVGLSLRLVQDSLRLTIADDGDGFQPPEPLAALAAEGKWGLAEMVEHAAVVGGQLDISSVLGVGTQVRVRLPLDPKQAQPPPVADELLEESLTPRELEVLAGVAAGLTNKQIAVQLGISDRTVQFHLGNVLGKLGVVSRTEAAVLALQLGLV
jgi:signal transduction histidine kinase/DNA-binding CsgD family transcriptional regulator